MIEKKYLYKTVYEMEDGDLRVVSLILIALYNRFITLENKELYSDGAALEKLIDQKDSIESLIVNFELLRTKIQNKESQEDILKQIDICKKKTFWHQSYYGGLKALKL